MKFLNRLLYQVHRWVGVVLALFMFAWFLTGLVIMYAPSITQNRSQQLAHAETLAPEIGWLSLGDVWARSAEQREALAAKQTAAKAEANANAKAGKDESKPSIVDARLVRIAEQPVWLIEDSQAQRYALSALDASIRETSPEQALSIAKHWYYQQHQAFPSHIAYLETLSNPIILRNQEALQPFHKIAVGEDGGQLLISQRTGEVLHASNKVSRTFYWAGNWLHLLKPMDAIGWGQYRHDAQVWLGFSATLATFTGLIIGWLRWRPGFGGKKTYSEGRTQPYREFWFKWHFWSGLLGGTVALFWALSGYVSTNPSKIFSPTNPTKQELARYFADELPEAMRTWVPALPLALATAVDGADIVELNWRRVGAQAVLLAHTRDGQRLPQTLFGAKASFDETVLQAAMTRVAAKQPISSVIRLDHYDSYYYPRHNQSNVERPLPVLVMRLADAVGTRFYLDPQDGRLLAKFDRSARLFRWLYTALHHWDFGWLYYRPLWDAWMLTWVSFGLVLGGSSLVIGWRLLRKTFGTKQRVPVITPATRYKPSKAIIAKTNPEAKQNVA